MIRIIVDKVRRLGTDGNVVESVLDYTAALEDGALILAEAHQPFVAAARALIERGADPGELCTVRHKNKLYDSFVPMKLRDAAHWTVAEGDVSTHKDIPPTHVRGLAMSDETNEAFLRQALQDLIGRQMDAFCHWGLVSRPF